MANINYMNDTNVKKYYEEWALNPVLSGRDKENFYKFVKACLNLDKQLDIDYLKLALYDSFAEHYNEKEYDEFVFEVIVLFEHLRDFNNTTLP